MNVRTATEAELDLLASIWYDGWQDAHARILPAELARHRTLESFRHRLQSNLQNVRVAGSPDEPLGLCITSDDELYQLYVSASARGSGLAAALLTDAEERLSSLGVQTAWLACAIGNTRAAKFYEKHGWNRVGNMTSQLPTPDGVFPLEVWRYEKGLNEARRPSVGVAHVVLETNSMERSSQFMRTIGMRPIFDGPEVSVYEMRGGTHLILMRKDTVVTGDAPFDLMVDDLHATHERFKSVGLAPSPIEARPAIDHEIFTVREPTGHVITFFSSHASGKPT
ncbi:GNAT family N-acetyltransferase [Exilibacterium tricleocarpae]|uniref:GNAT family N-acetyltransferase n=1 Tax=Exilibacterium tricleocarpae TaxID=2591008 RepID=A0A545SXC0_9GAMM|nr:GNAT family N-acetyltransferase [Exilibacterium tricleocarpae]TQV69611.1 GNAT family N-acetyltransferase [Exilibacterium tricleocarpae]